MAVFDFKSIRRSLERQEQKAEFEEKNPVSFVDPVTAKVVWTPEQGYGTAAVPLADDLAQQLADCYAYASYPRFTAKI